MTGENGKFGTEDAEDTEVFLARRARRAGSIRGMETSSATRFGEPSPLLACLGPGAVRDDVHDQCRPNRSATFYSSVSSVSSVISVLNTVELAFPSVSDRLTIAR